MLTAGGLRAQAVLTPENMAMGGGGTAYLTGFSANFLNPANLMIREREQTLDIGVGLTSGTFRPVRGSTGLVGQFKNYSDRFLPYDIGRQNLTGGELNRFVLDQYGDSDTRADYSARFESILFGFSWKSGDKAYSVTLRTRTASRFTVGRGWYDINSVDADGSSTIDRTLRQQTATFHELSLGYAESFTFLNGLSPHLSKLYVGLAPKFILAGPQLDATYRSEYQSAGTGLIHARSFNYYAAGDLGKLTDYFLKTNDLASAISRDLSNASMLNPSGLGIGLDVGLTYLITLGNDVSQIQNGNQAPTRKSLRLSFSITDVGFVTYADNPIHLAMLADTVASSVPDRASRTFGGAPGEYLAFIENNEGNNSPFNHYQGISRHSYSNQLPTALHTGLLLQVNRVKLTGDLGIGLTDNAFNTTKLTAHLGSEIRPFPFWALRGGVRLARNRNTLFSFGTGVETTHWDLNLATLISSAPNDLSYELVGGAVAALTLHF